MPRPDPLASLPFSYATRGDGTVVIRYHTAPVALLRGRAADRFMTRISSADAAGAQRLMAHAAGTVTSGDERRT